MKDTVSTILPCCVAILSAMPVWPSLGWRRAETRAGQDTSPTQSTLCSQQFIDAENAKRCNDVQADDYADSIADCTHSQNNLHTYSVVFKSVDMFRPQVHALGGHGSQVVYPMALFFFTSAGHFSITSL